MWETVYGFSHLLKYPNMISQWAMVYMVTKRTKRLLYVNEKIEELWWTHNTLVVD